MGTRLESDTSFKGKRKMDWIMAARLKFLAAKTSLDIEISPGKLREIADNMEEDYENDPETTPEKCYGVTLSQTAGTISPIHLRILWCPLGKEKETL